MYKFLYSLISFLISIFFIMLGVIGVMLPWSPWIRTDIIQFILEDSMMIFLFGFFMIVIGLAIVVNIFLNLKRRYYRIKSKNNSCLVSETVFQEYLNAYWKDLFPKQNIPNHVLLKKEKVHVDAELPYVPPAQQEKLLKKIEKDLSGIFNRHLGYNKEYILSISFGAEPLEKAIK